MIRTNGKEISNANLNGKVVEMMFLGARKIWEAIRSCFNGIWRSDLNWTDNDMWKSKQ